MINEVLQKMERKMEVSVEAFKTDLASIRTGHASPSLVEHIKVDYAGVPTPINHMASVSAPEARMLVIQPWDKGIISAIEKALLKSDLGINPSNDGVIIRIAIPPLNEERRQDLIKVVRKRVEERRVIIRNLRHETINDLRKLEKSKEISQDDLKRAQDKIQKLTDRFIADVDSAGQEKESELKEV